LPDADPGDRIAHRWRKRLCKRIAGNESKKITLIDIDKLTAATTEAQLRCKHVCSLPAYRRAARLRSPRMARRCSRISVVTNWDRAFSSRP
jgi:hypothetical protein